ncbi:hypothetical protein HWV62_26608 [Athelia sp. TMB]|nr:hypothetical protein HWV62_26608 [Athelia sp. TMB]
MYVLSGRPDGCCGDRRAARPLIDLPRGLVILWYDHIISLPLEIASIWRRPKTLISWIYLVNRYTASFGNIAFFVIDWLTLSSKASLIHQHSSPRAKLPGCKLEHTTENAIRLAVPWECMLIYDAVVLVFTVRKTYKLAAARARAAFKADGVHIPTIILRDGILYFAGMTVCNALNILCFYITPPLLKGGLSTFNSIVDVTLVSRMVLNLRDLATPGPDATEGTQEGKPPTPGD